MIIKTNKKGIAFSLRALPGNRTEIKTEDETKLAVVGHNITRITSSWYMWVHEGDSLFNAFHYLEPFERRFIDKGEI